MFDITDLYVLKIYRYYQLSDTNKSPDLVEYI